MTFDRRHERGTTNWLHAGSLAGYATRIVHNPEKAYESENVESSESTFSGANSVSDAKSASKFLTLFDVY